MKGTLLEITSDSRADERSSRARSVVAVITALVIVSLIGGGYLFLRKRHAQQRLIATQAQQSADTKPKGPPKVQIFVDDAMLKDGQTLIGGTVKNISNEDISSVSIDLELIRRRDATTEKTSVQVMPAQLAPQAEGHYSLSLNSKEYGSVKLLGLKEGRNASSLVFLAAQGQKRPAEKLESRTIIVKRPSTPHDGFINTPDNPSRVP